MHFLIILALSIAVGALLYRFVRQRSPSRVLTLGGAFLASVLTFGALVPTATHSPTSPVQASDEQHDRAVETAQSPAAAQMSQASAKTLYINAGAMIIRPSVDRMIRPSSKPMVRQRQAMSFSLAKRLRVALSSANCNAATSPTP